MHLRLAVVDFVATAVRPPLMLVAGASGRYTSIDIFDYGSRRKYDFAEDTPSQLNVATVSFKKEF